YTVYISYIYIYIYTHIYIYVYMLLYICILYIALRSGITMDRRRLYRRGPGTRRVLLVTRRASRRKIKSSNQTKYLIRHSLFALAEPENTGDNNRWIRMIFGYLYET